MTVGQAPDEPGRRASLEFVWDVAQRFHERQLRDYDAVDTKAGVLLGFSAALVALGANVQLDPARIVGSGLAVLATIFAAMAFRPRDLRTLRPRHMREQYLNLSPRDSMLKSLDSLLDRIDTNESRQKEKVQWMRRSIWTLVAAAVILGVGATVPIDEDHGGNRHVRTR